MARKRRPKLTHHIPDGPPALFQVVEHRPGETYWSFTLRDAIYGDEPEFRYEPPKKGCPFTVHELAVAAACELNEATGRITIEEVIDGIPTFTAIYISDGHSVYCAWSTDANRAKPVDITAAEKWLAERQRDDRTLPQERD
jgi:hypothetical protein